MVSERDLPADNLSGRSAFHARAAAEGLLGWIVLIKDLRKKIGISLEELSLVRGSVAFLTSHDDETPEQPLFGELSVTLVHLMTGLRQLHECTRDDLVVLQLLLDDSRSYDDLANASSLLEDVTALRSSAVTPEPQRQGSAALRYAASLHVLLATPLHLVTAALEDMLREEQSIDLGGLKIIAGLLELLMLHLKLKGDGYLEGRMAEVEFLKLLVKMQDMPWFQPMRIDQILSRSSNSDFKLRERIVNWMMDAKADGRVMELIGDGINLWAVNAREETRYFCSKIANLDILNPQGGKVLRALFDLDPDAPWDDVSKSAGQFVPTQPLDPERKAIAEVAAPNVSQFLKDITEEHGLDNLVEDGMLFLTELGQRCWQMRRTLVLQRLARVSGGDIPEVSGPELSPIHEELFTRVGHYHAELEDIFSALRATMASLRQRAAILAPAFPMMPRTHSRAAEGYEREVLSIVNSIGKRTLKVLLVLRTDVKTHSRITVDIAFDYVVASSMAHHGLNSKSRAAVVVLPFYCFFTARYLADVAHEVAHADIITDDIASLIGDDSPERNRALAQWKEPIGHILSLMGRRLAEAHADSGTKASCPEGLVGEILADAVALWTIGPCYLYSLLFATVARADIPPRDAADSGIRFINPTEVNPMVRIGALLGLARAMEIGSSDSASGDDLPLAPVESIWNAYFRILRDRADAGFFEEERALALFQLEMSILTDGLRDIWNLTQSKVWVRGATTFLWGPSCPTEVTEEVACFERELGRMPGATLPSSRGTPNAAAGSKKIVRDKTLVTHALWWSVLARYREAVAGSARHIDWALWGRTPEVRPMMTLLGHELPTPASPGVGNLDEGDLVSVVHIDAFWLHVDSATTAWEQIQLDHDHAYWVIGDYDFLTISPRWTGVEDLRPPVRRLREVIPAQPRYSYVRHEDYVVAQNWTEDATRPRAHLRLSLDKPLPVRSLVELTEGLDRAGARISLLLVSVGSDNVVIHVEFDTFLALSNWTTRLRKALKANGRYVRHYTMDILQRPLSSQSDQRSALRKVSEGIGVTFAIRLRCRRQDLNTDGLVRLARNAVPNLGPDAAIHTYECTGRDTIEVYVQLGACDGLAGTLEQLACYTDVASRVAKTTQAVDIHTSVLLPESNDES